MAVTITRRAKNSIRGLYNQSNRNSIQQQMEVKSCWKGIQKVITTTPLNSVFNVNGLIINQWKSLGYTVVCTTSYFVRRGNGVVVFPIRNFKERQRVWYFATIKIGNMLYIIDACFCKYLDKPRPPIPTARSVAAYITKSLRKKRLNVSATKQLQIPFPPEQKQESFIKNKTLIKESQLRSIIRETIKKLLRA